MTGRARSSSSHHARTGSPPGRRPRVSTAGHRNAQAKGPSPCTGCRRTPARTPRSRPRPSPGPGPRAARPARRPAGGGPTPPSGTPPHRTTPPRSWPWPRTSAWPAPVAAPARSPDPASPRSTPARRTRTAACPARPRACHSARYVPPMTPGRPRVARRGVRGKRRGHHPSASPSSSGTSRNISIPGQTYRNQVLRRNHHTNQPDHAGKQRIPAGSRPPGGARRTT